MSASHRPQIWVSQPLFDDIVERLDAHFDVSAARAVTTYDAADVAARLRTVEGAIVTLNERIGAAEVVGATGLKVIANVGVGYNNLDVDALSAAGILVTNTPDVLTETTADFGFALMMAVARRVAEGDRMVRAGEWRQWSFDTLLGGDLHGSTLGILGMGRIGQAIARRAAGFNMRVLYHNRRKLQETVERDLRAQYVDLAGLLAQSDHLLLALPYSPAVHHLIDAAALSRMQPGATLVNIARGGLVDERALMDALKAGRLAGAGLDVFENEPLIRPELMELPNLTLTPHVGSASLTARRAMAALAVDNLMAALGKGPMAGDPPTPVNAASIKR